ncbi:TPA: hypothetical protein I8Z33_001286 [Legionella pneumophila]|nr:hypothetical protein [Legionella pneumophila]HAT1861000.1 hypothetical protein [Legionella pneumophila]
MRDYWLTKIHNLLSSQVVSVVGFLDEGLLVLDMLLVINQLLVSVVGFLDEGLLGYSRSW